MSITDEQHWSQVVAHLRVALRHMNALDCADVSPNDVAALKLLIGRVRHQSELVERADRESGVTDCERHQT